MSKENRKRNGAHHENGNGVSGSVSDIGGNNENNRQSAA
jgi:hypothetical protein